MGTIEVDDRGRVTIPKEIRDRLGIRPGDEVTVEVVDGEIQLRPEISSIQTVSRDEDWGPEAFRDAGEATFGDR